MDSSYIDFDGAERYFFELYHTAKKQVEKNNVVHMNSEMFREYIEERNRNSPVSIRKENISKIYLGKKKKDIPQIIIKEQKHTISKIPHRLNLEKIAILGAIDSPLGMLSKGNLNLNLNYILAEKYSEIVKDIMGIYNISQNNSEYIRGKKLYLIGSLTNNLENSEKVRATLETENSITGIVENFKDILANTEITAKILPIYLDDKVQKIVEPAEFEKEAI